MSAVRGDLFALAASAGLCLLLVVPALIAQLTSWGLATTLACCSR